MGDFSWADMPEELAGLLYEAITSGQHRHEDKVVDEAFEWLDINIKSCSATTMGWASIAEGRCGEMPIPGSEFCPLHMPAGELGEDAKV